jgi:hypothetical protein
MTSNKDHTKLDAELKNSLAVLQDIPTRDEKRALHGRSQFLTEARTLKQSVTPAAERRPNRWMENIQTRLPFRKEGVPMFTQIISALLILITLAGGAGAGTVYAAQSSMPADVLYPVKTWSENARLGLATSPEKDIDLLLEFANRRIEEMLVLAEEGAAVPEPLMTRLQTHLDLALQLCDQLQDSQQTRQQIRQTMMTQQKLIDKAPQEAQLLQTRDMLQQRIHQIDQTPLLDPAQDQDQLQQQDRDRLRTDQPEDAGNPEANGYQEEQNSGGPNPNLDAPDQQSGGQAPQRTKTPMPGQSGQQQGPGGPDSSKGPGN